MTRPLTPFLIFYEKQRKDGTTDIKEVSEKWKKLSDGKKKKYLDQYRTAKEKYDKFLQDVYGAEPLTYRPTGRTIEFSMTRVRAILGLKPAIKPMSKGLYPALVKVLVRFWRRNCVGGVFPRSGK